MRIKDPVYNFFLNIIYRITRIFHKEPNIFNPNLNLEIYDSFKNVDDLWERRLWWGNYSETEETEYQDPECIIQQEDNVKLISKHEPKINIFNNKTMKYARGNLYCKEIFYSGAIEVVVNMKPAKYIWHAPLWFVTIDKVLPEIDVSEVYCKGNLKKAGSETNIHYGQDYDKKKKKIGAKTHFLPNMFNRDVSFGIIWNDKHIKIYYDGYLVRKITNKDILRRIKKGMVPIIGVGVTKKTKEHTVSEMTVKSFKYWK